MMMPSTLEETKKHQETTILSESIDFFKNKKILVSADDFGLKSIYRCDIFTSLEEAIEEYNLMNEDNDEGLVVEEKE